MSRYELHAVPASKDIALLFFDAEAGLSYAHIYPEYEQYPLATDRYVRNRRNLFVDIIDILDGNNPFSDDVRDFNLTVAGRDEPGEIIEL